MYESMLRVITEEYSENECFRISGDDLEMLAAIADELRIPAINAHDKAILLMKAVASGYFTIIQEYEQEVNGVSVTLSPLQWREWVDEGKLPKVDDQIEQINALIASLYRLRERMTDGCVRFGDVPLNDDDECAMNVVF
jgi:hypothetical protein